MKIKKEKRPIKIGHTGTLDKAAEGLLILPFGAYTSFSSVFLEEDKGYYAKVRFGKYTDSGDREGNTLEEWTDEKVRFFYENNLERIKEEILKIKEVTTQIPPVISALKVGGKRQSSLYRDGIEFQSVSRKIQIYSLAYQNLNEFGFEINLKVSSGTYIRKIVMDISQNVGLPMFVEKLIRTSIGKISLDQAISVEDAILPDSKFFKLKELIYYPWLELNEVETCVVSHGGYIDTKGAEGDFFLRDSNDNLLAWCSTKEKKPHLPYKYKKVFHNPI